MQKGRLRCGCHSDDLQIVGWWQQRILLCLFIVIKCNWPAPVRGLALRDQVDKKQWLFEFTDVCRSLPLSYPQLESPLLQLKNSCFSQCLLHHHLTDRVRMIGVVSFMHKLLLVKSVMRMRLVESATMKSVGRDINKVEPGLIITIVCVKLCKTRYQTVIKQTVIDSNMVIKHVLAEPRRRRTLDRGQYYSWHMLDF